MATVLEGQSTKTIRSTRSRKTGTGLLRGTYTLWLKQMKKFTSSSMELVSTLFFPMLWMFLFGVCMDASLQGVGDLSNGIGYQAFITPGVMLLTCLTAATLGGASLLTDRINGIVKEYLVAPVPRLSIMLGIMGGGLTKALLQAFVVLLIGMLLTPALILNGLTILASFGIMATYSLGFIGIAVAFASKARETEGYHALIMLLNLPVLFVSNALYPLNKIPDVIVRLALLNPTTYAVDATRHLLYGAPTEIGMLIDIPVLLAFTIVGVWFGYKYFRLSVKNLDN